MQTDTLIVVAAVDDRFHHNLATLRGGPIVVMDTSGGGHPSKAYIDAYRKYDYYDSYLFLQDSLESRVEDCVVPFREMGDVTAWGLFPLQWDSDGQRQWVQHQYPSGDPEFGIFGPIFYATREKLLVLDDRGLFPDTPPDRHMAQGTERAWAYAFHHANIPMETLGFHDNNTMASGEYPVFTKTFAGRP